MHRGISPSPRLEIRMLGAPAPSAITRGGACRACRSRRAAIRHRRRRPPGGTFGPMPEAGGADTSPHAVSIDRRDHDPAAHPRVHRDRHLRQRLQRHGAPDAHHPTNTRRRSTAQSPTKCRKWTGGAAIAVVMLDRLVTHAYKVNLPELPRGRKYHERRMGRRADRGDRRRREDHDVRSPTPDDDRGFGRCAFSQRARRPLRHAMRTRSSQRQHAGVS